MKRILFISTHSFATNPRLVKEIELALKNNYAVTVLCCAFDNSTKNNNDKIKLWLAPQINYYEIPGSRWPLIPWLMSAVIAALSKISLRLKSSNLFWLSVHSNKRSWLLLQNLEKIKEKIDLVVAHNAGSFYPAELFAKNNNIPFGIDLEDYHPGETNNSKEAAYAKSVLKNSLPKAVYISAASPLILEYSIRDAGALNCAPVVVQNYFPSAEFIFPAEKEEDKLQLVWFSQHISYNRGLEQVLPIIKNNAHAVLHLFGNCNEQFKKEWLADTTNIFIHPALPQQELHKGLCRFDIGFAIEPGKDLNNELAISNKMLAYFQAGLYIVASNTKAQSKFITTHPEHGRVTDLHSADLNVLFEQLFQQKNEIRKQAVQRFDAARKECWETEAGKLVTAWQQVLS